MIWKKDLSGFVSCFNLTGHSTFAGGRVLTYFGVNNILKIPLPKTETP